MDTVQYPKQLNNHITAVFKCQTRVEKLHKMAKSFLYTSYSRQITTRGNYGRLSAVALTKNGETEEEKRRNRKQWRNRKVWSKPASSSIFFCLLLVQSGPDNSNSVISNSPLFRTQNNFHWIRSLVIYYWLCRTIFRFPWEFEKAGFKYTFVGYRRNVPRTHTIVHLFDKLKKRTHVHPDLCPLFWCSANKSREQSTCFGWLTVTNMFGNRSHVKYEFINTKKLVKMLARREASSGCRQQFANVFADCFYAVHRHQHKFANTSLPC